MDSHKAENWANLILHVALISTFIGIFFFTYAAKVEERIVRDQVQYLVNDFTADAALYPAEIRQAIKNQLASSSVPDMSKADNMVAVNNAALLKKAAMVLGGFLAASLAVVYYLHKQYQFDIKSLLIENFIILMFVAVTEYVFITYVAAKNRIADPNHVKLMLLKTLIH